MIRLIAFRTLFALTSILTALTVARPALAGGCHDRQCAQPAVTHAQLHQAWLVLCENPQLCRKHPELAAALQKKFGPIPGAAHPAPAVVGLPKPIVPSATPVPPQPVPQEGPTVVDVRRATSPKAGGDPVAPKVVEGPQPPAQTRVAPVVDDEVPTAVDDVPDDLPPGEAVGG